MTLYALAYSRLINRSQIFVIGIIKIPFSNSILIAKICLSNILLNISKLGFRFCWNLAGKRRKRQRVLRWTLAHEVSFFPFRSSFPLHFFHVVQTKRRQNSNFII
jgi:hypothetical protein